jgi:hypothetical protein
VFLGADVDPGGVGVDVLPPLIDGDFLLLFLRFNRFSFHGPDCGFGPRVA